MAANQPFSAWDKVFPDQAITVAAIDRLVHHATILKLNGDSYHRRTAAGRQSAKADAGTTASSDYLETETRDNIHRRRTTSTNQPDRSGQNRPARLSGTGQRG
ncbi:MULTISPECIES: ATP-binding protein [Marivita]|uniref:ATP-binding protein n=1 Tax=Marivita cryptomonadis TaxID=505252 RepID=A0A9Q2NWF4_9RHOB|nr:MULTISPECIES: ATP-binding protein [Marivita]MBM2324188.1 ATP-binding protein [Marivita cryptomonadis]MBM2333778.1 ATP-binding protein [Marivita cryptomonadis]MBM2343355.1 ATP-binding protein [Marivita cryptomonadis]MBM2348027.1 ATP-binding protein [Marivita cryptomonadis]MBM2352708.1 ATP-binding protein [Marivita cryptomonadis]